MVIVMLCHGVPVNGVLRRTASSVWATQTPAAEPISSDALPVDGSTALPELLRFLPLHSQPDKSSDLSTTLLPNNASDLLESLVLLVSPDEATRFADE